MAQDAVACGDLCRVPWMGAAQNLPSLLRCCEVQRAVLGEWVPDACEVRLVCAGRMKVAIITVYSVNGRFLYW